MQRMDESQTNEAEQKKLGTKSTYFIIPFYMKL